MPVQNASRPDDIALPDIALHMLMNDSAPLLLDWVLHHRHVGFRRIIVHGDGANPQATALAEALAGAGLIAFIPTDRPGIAQVNARQIRAMADALRIETDLGTDFLLWLQPEDLLVVDTGGGHLADLAAQLDHFPDILSLTVQVAGGSGEYRYVDAALPDRFKRGTGGAKGPMLYSTPLRTIFRPHLAKTLQVARPQLKPKFARGKESVTWLNGAGEDVGDRYLQKGWMAPPEQPGLGFGHVMSFMAQDRETFLLRRTGSGEVLPFITPNHLSGVMQQYQRIDFNRTEVGAAVPDPQGPAARRAAFLTDRPEITQCHEDVVAEFSGRLDRLLPRQDPKAVDLISAFLAGGRITATEFDWPVPFGIPTTPPALSETDSAWAERLTRPADNTAVEADDWVDTEGEYEAAPARPAPSDAVLVEAPAWLSDLRLSGQAHGFYHSMPNYACTYVARSREHLLVSFDNLASVRENPVSREPWGYNFVRKEGWSHLGILSYVPGWFRDINLHRYLLSLRDSGFFEQFDQVTMFGTSMGGYGAAAFASLAPGCRVAAFSPQSTLSPQLAAWDQRYPTGKHAKWDGLFVDAAVESRHAAQVWLFYDPAVPHDLRHVRRFDAENVIPVPLRHADHKTALMLKSGRILSSVMRDIVHGHATLAGTMKAYRACRTLPEYVESLKAKAKRTGGAGRVKRIDRALGQLRNLENSQYLAKNISL
ncbi:hypothetical protein E4L95_12480 [Paracoccus liaowanqingii]|uniref:Glycosyl transferase family 2 n=1 Tax=Paracoccus liaowanqingii TaxID=2560053 RepID=A0A4Z1CA10_9RHOB|nr:hypothetical protein [Paracoccus liaowanqingii]TGN58370.1 hypothetical protein E4L95_12480 [Paracoccus liaowanqingii]